MPAASAAALTCVKQRRAHPNEALSRLLSRIPDRVRSPRGAARLAQSYGTDGDPMTKRRARAVVVAALLAAAPAYAGDVPQATPSPAPPAAESPKSHPPAAQPPKGVSFTRDVKQAWTQAGEDGRRAGRAIGDSARSFGRATRDAAVRGWRSVKEAFSG